MPSFQATYDRSYAHLQVRGFHVPGDYNSQILVQTAIGYENLQDYAGLDSDFFLAMQDIERIEVVRGSASSLHGTSAMLAVINVISKRPTSSYLEIQSQAGSFSSYQGRLTGSIQSPNTQVYFAATL